MNIIAYGEVQKLNVDICWSIWGLSSPLWEKCLCNTLVIDSLRLRFISFNWMWYTSGIFGNWDLFKRKTSVLSNCLGLFTFIQILMKLVHVQLQLFNLRLVKPETKYHVDQTTSVSWGSMGTWRERLGPEEVIAEATNGLALLVPRLDDNFGTKGLVILWAFMSEILSNLDKLQWVVNSPGLCLWCDLKWKWKIRIPTRFFIPFYVLIRNPGEPKFFCIIEVPHMFWCD